MINRNESKLIARERRNLQPRNNSTKSATKSGNTPAGDGKTPDPASAKRADKHTRRK